MSPTLRRFDEMYTDPAACGASPAATDPAAVRAHYKDYAAWLAGQPADVMQARRDEAEMIFRRVGITFAVYGAKDEDAGSDNGGT